MNTSIPNQSLSDAELRFRQGAGYPKPQQPIFETLDQAREDQKRTLAKTFRIFGKLGFEEGVMGHVSVRDPENPEHFWINPFGLSFNLITAKDLMKVNVLGEVIEGEGYPHPGGIPLHSAIYRENQAIRSIAHAHSIHGRTWSSTGKLIPPFGVEAAVFFERHALYDTYKHGEGDELAKAIAANRALIMLNHGLLTVGSSVEEAAYLFISMEKVCQTLLSLSNVEEVNLLSDDNARLIAERFTPYHGWLNFQPISQNISSAT